MKKQVNQKSRIVQIIVHGEMAFVPAKLRSLVAPVLEHPVQRFRIGGQLGYRHEVEIVEHYHVANGRVMFSAGLVPRVQNHVAQNGYTVQVMGHPVTLTASDVDLELFHDPNVTSEEQRFLSALINQPRGQIRVPRSSDVGRFIALFARFVHELNLFVVARNQQRVHHLVNEIGKHTDRAVSCDSRTTWQHSPRIFVGTVQLFHHAMAEGFHIGIFTDSESILATRTAIIPRVWQDRTWYAFLAFPNGLSEYEQFRLEEICGPVIYAPQDDYPEARVDVEFVPVDRAAHSGTDFALERKRVLYWHSSAWNEMVSKIAATRVDRRRRRTVSILVESSEHGRELLRSLRGWELRTNNTFTTCIPTVGHRQIATFDYAERWGIGTDVVIRADGGSGWPLSHGFVRLVHYDVDTVLLIDFADSWDRLARKDTESRQAAYQRRGWNISGPTGR